MAVLKPGAPLATKEPFLLVENQLPVGKYLFQLVVVDEDGQRSEPMQAVVVVEEAPTRTPFDRTAIFIPASSPINPGVLRPRIP